MGPEPLIGFAHRVHHGPGWGVWVLGILVTAAFWALVVLAIVWLVRSIPGRGTGTAPAGRHQTGGPTAGDGAVRYPPPPPTPGAATGPDRILAERFARGEIDEGEYRARLAVLRSTAEGTPPETAPPGPPAA